MRIPVWTWTIVLATGYAACIWWSVRGASSRVRCALLVATASALGLRLVSPHEFPWGYHEDELLTAIGSLQFYCRGNVLGTLSNGLQAGLYSTMGGPLMLYLGAGGIRAYSLVASIVAVPLSFGLARAVGISVTAALSAVVSAYVAMPWALLGGRTSIGSEAILHGLVVALALTKLLRPDSSRTDLLTPSGILLVGLFLCCLSYTAAKVMLLAPALAVLCLPTERRVARIMAIAAATGVAILLYNQVAYGHLAWYGFDVSILPEEQRPLSRLGVQFPLVWRAFWTPVETSNVTQSVSFSQVVPWPLLLCVIVGLPQAIRKSRSTRLLVLLFLLGLLPALLGPSNLSTHRLIMAGMYIPFLVAAGIDLAPPGRWRQVTAAVVVAITIGWGVQSYFAPTSWSLSDRKAFCSFGCALEPPGSPRGLPLQCSFCEQFSHGCTQELILEQTAAKARS